MKDEMIRTTVYIPEKLIKAAKIQAVKSGVTVTAAVRILLEQWIRNGGKF